MINLYVIGPSAGPVKIGISGSAAVRLKTLQTSHPRKLKIIVEVPGGEHEEEETHKFLAPWRLEGEWFSRSEEVERFIGLLVQRIPVITALRSLIERREMTAKMWARMEHRRKKKDSPKVVNLTVIRGGRVEEMANDDI